MRNNLKNLDPDSLTHWVETRLEESVMGDMPKEKRSILARLITLDLMSGKPLTQERLAIPGIQPSGTFRMVLARVTRAFREGGEHGYKPGMANIHASRHMQKAA